MSQPTLETLEIPVEILPKIVNNSKVFKRIWQLLVSQF